jgi:3-dehydroquinate synthase
MPASHPAASAVSASDVDTRTLPAARTVRVNLPGRSYDVVVGAGLLGQAGRLVREVAPAKTAAVLGDSFAAARFGPAVRSALEAAGYRTCSAEFPAGEESKTLATVSALYDRLFAAEPPLDRGSPVVAVGGGVTGDMAGFVAGTFKRGVPFIQVPTTLLAMVDASVGGKTGVNHPTGKNLIGVVHQPSRVIADVDTLTGLPADQFSSGLAECVKHALALDVELLGWLEANAGTLVSRVRGAPGWTAAVIELVARNVAIKARIVENDETEQGLRAVLNYGHTVGHALEAVCGYGRLLHGQAVAVGLMAEAAIAVARGWVPPELLERQRRLLSAVGLPVALTAEFGPTPDVETLIPAMRQDKKTRDGRVRFVLPTGVGKVDIFDDVTESEVRSALATVLPTRPGR